jgi:two-component system, OmpR family, sensor kinase
MTLSTRLTVLLIAITTVVALLVGWFAVATSSRADYSSIDNTINEVIASGAGHPLTTLSSALNIVQENNYDVTMDVVGPNGKVTQIASGDVPMTNSPTKADVARSIGAVRSSSDLAGFRYRSIGIGGGDYLVVAESTAGIASREHQLIERTVLVGLIAAIAMGVTARLFMRRDLRIIKQLISFATSVAHGDVEQSIPPAVGSSDIRELQTALAQMVRSLQRTIETEQRITKATQQFIGDASHELRTPLTVIKGYTELLSNTDVTDEQQARALDRVQKEVGRMDVLVNDLLFLAEVNEVPILEGTSVNLSSTVRTVTSDFATDHPNRSVTTSIGDGVWVTGRGEFLERLILNALGNIARHTGDTDAVKVSLFLENSRLVLRFEDAGPGMPEGSYGTRPERFQRFDDSRSRSSGGSGLGMSIMADIATSMGGTMTTAKSALGGLELSFSFPYDAAPPR